MGPDVILQETKSKLASKRIQVVPQLCDLFASNHVLEIKQKVDDGRRANHRSCQPIRRYTIKVINILVDRKQTGSGYSASHDEDDNGKQTQASTNASNNCTNGEKDLHQTRSSESRPYHLTSSPRKKKINKGRVCKNEKNIL